MAHFAKLDSNNIVTEVLVVNNEVILKADNTESEYKGKVFLNGLFGNATWIQTSFSASFRKKFASIGDKYDETNDVFISPKPFESWVLNSNFDWQAPIEYPTDDNLYEWDEETKAWVAVPKPVQPYSSWIWNKEFWDWFPPVEYPTDGKEYEWNESNQSWDFI